MFSTQKENKNILPRLVSLVLLGGTLIVFMVLCLSHHSGFNVHLQTHDVQNAKGIKSAVLLIMFFSSINILTKYQPVSDSVWVVLQETH